MKSARSGVARQTINCKLLRMASAGKIRCQQKERVVSRIKEGSAE